MFTPARRDLIERTVESVAGMRGQVVIHLYAATAPVWRDVVRCRTRDELASMIYAGAEDILRLAGDSVRFQFSPGVFNLTEPDFVLELSDQLTKRWDATPERPAILNLPATIEAATPNVYADQIEYMHKNLPRRDRVILSVHPHDDRGTGIAYAELAVLAGAQRVEGCIFGNGERTGNVDIATLALNLHAQGVDPMIDFSDMDRIRAVVEHCTRMPIHPRHHYVGTLVYTAFSGTRQDAIRKGFAVRGPGAWEVPYLPIDPADVGRGYEAVVRVNSQSGKGGTAYVLEASYGLRLSPEKEKAFAQHVQRHTDGTGREASAEELKALYEEVYGCSN